MIVDTDDLVTSVDIARRTDMTAGAVSKWKARHDDFPQPVFDQGHIKLYLWSQVREWLSTPRTYTVTIPERYTKPVVITYTTPPRFPPKETT